MENKKIELSFEGLNISNDLISVLTKNKFTSPTPIQHQVIPIALSGKDVVGIAQTGTGKTLAFSIPMIQRLLSSNGQGLILLPTRELAIQVEEVIAKIGYFFKFKTALLIGGAPIGNQIASLRRDPDIIIATPGRLADHLNQGTFSLKHVSIIVLDEADRMFDVGFAPQIKKVMDLAPKERQVLLFSATMPPEIITMANKYMKDPLRIEIAPAGTSAEFVEQEVIIIAKEAKIQLLDKILQETKETVLVFVRTRHSAKKLTKEVYAMGHTVCEIHSDRSLAQRKDALAGFKSGKYRILIATDIAARGIDVKDISLVVNYDLPDDLSDYVHRIGRTGRNGSSGKAVSFVTRQEKFSVSRIEKIIKKDIKISETPLLPDRRPSAIPKDEENIGFRRRGMSGGRDFQDRGPRRDGGRSSYNRGPRRDDDYSREDRPRTQSNPFEKPAKFQREDDSFGEERESRSDFGRNPFQERVQPKREERDPFEKKFVKKFDKKPSFKSEKPKKTYNTDMKVKKDDDSEGFKGRSSGSRKFGNDKFSSKPSKLGAKRKPTTKRKFK